MQIRNLLAQLLSVTANSAGAKTSPNDFIPQRSLHELDLETYRSEMEIWAIKYNATLQ